MRGIDRTFTTDDTGTDEGGAAFAGAIAADLGTGCVGSVIDVVLGEVEGIAILGAVAFGSRRTCFVVRISFAGKGWVGSCTSGCTDGDAGDMDTFEPTGGNVQVGNGCRIAFTTAAAEVGRAEPGLIICVACAAEWIDVATGIC